MKNQIKKIFILALFAALVACNSQKTKETSSATAPGYPPLKERTGVLSQSSDWIIVKNKAAELFMSIEADSADTKSRLLLAQLYMQEARITGEHPYYYPATLTILNDVLRNEPENFEALAFKSSVQLSLHHFKEALETGKRAMTINANNGFIYGVLCDANVELGNYEEAVKMSDRMQSVRPGLESYSRASYLREIYGDNNGAKVAMKMAYEAGLPGSEESSWAGNALAHLYINTGDLKNAEDLSNAILLQRPSYAFATDALGSIELARGNYDKAIALFDNAIKVMPEFSFYENKAKAYESKGEFDKAKEIYNTVLTMLKEDAAAGHYAEMDMAMVYLKLKDLTNALKYAKIEYERRPDNIDVNNTMAWVHYHMGNYTDAKMHMDKALRMGTQNAELLYRASVIEMAAGNRKAAVDYSSASKKINPFLKIETSDRI